MLGYDMIRIVALLGEKNWSKSIGAESFSTNALLENVNQRKDWDIFIVKRKLACKRGYRTEENYIKRKPACK
jgi:hypothetical protein